MSRFRLKPVLSADDDVKDVLRAVNEIISNGDEGHEMMINKLENMDKKVKGMKTHAIK